MSYHFRGTALGGSRRITLIEFSTEQLEWFGYPMVKNVLRLRFGVSTEYRRVTDRRTDRRTDRHLATA